MSAKANLTSLDGLTERLQALHRRTQETPLFNPVFQLSHELSRGLESGELTLKGLSVDTRRASGGTT